MRLLSGRCRPRGYRFRGWTPWRSSAARPDGWSTSAARSSKPERGESRFASGESLSPPAMLWLLQPVADAASGVGLVTEARDDVHVGVHRELAADRAAVPADVVPIGMVLLVHPGADPKTRPAGTCCSYSWPTLLGASLRRERLS